MSYSDQLISLELLFIILYLIELTSSAIVHIQIAIIINNNKTMDL